MMKISIAMTTYNGEKYILEQLESILNQTKKANEVIICDDCSTDNTADLVKTFINQHNLENWTFIINDKNKGWKKNFLDTIQLTTGDIIFCSDQDDIWVQDKIEKMYDIMMKNKKIYCLCGKFKTIDSNNEDIDYDNLNRIKSEDYKLEEIIPKEFNNTINRFEVYGCTICFNKFIKNIIDEINYENFPHDAQIWQIATIFDAAYFYNKVVIKYRIHGNNSGGVSTTNNIGKSNINKRIESVIHYKEWLYKLMYNLKDKNINQLDYKLKIIEKSIRASENRENFLKTKKVFDYMKCIRYIKYYHSKSTLIGDLCYIYNINELCGRLLWIFKFKKI